MDIQVDYLSGGIIQYSIYGGTSCSFSSFEWYLSGATTGGKKLVSYSDTYITTPTSIPLPAINDQIWVNVTNFTQTYWLGGEFYGGDFKGNFGGGTFHYGQLNKCFYLKQEIKPKQFIENIIVKTGPSSVKPVNTARLL